MLLYFSILFQTKHIFLQMRQITEIQRAVFLEIKSKIPENVSFVHEIAELLTLSYDSAYRRIRGEKILSLEELQKISRHYQISIDAHFQVDVGKIAFDNLSISSQNFSISHWLQKILDDINKILQVSEKSIIYAAKDAPFMHFFQIPEIAAFKVFLWQKTLFQFKEYHDKKFSLSDYDDELQKIGKKILIASTKIPTIEIWNEDTFGIFIRQMEYYWISGLFRDENDIWILCDQLENWIRHIQHQAECGFKFLYGQEARGVDNSFQLYENDIVLNDNTILANMGGFRVVYLTYNVASLLVTTNQEFAGNIENFMHGLLKNSTLISSSAARERSRFFNKLINQVDQFRNRIKNSLRLREVQFPVS